MALPILLAEYRPTVTVSRYTYASGEGCMHLYFAVNDGEWMQATASCPLRVQEYYPYFALWSPTSRCIVEALPELGEPAAEALPVAEATATVVQGVPLQSVPISVPTATLDEQVKAFRSQLGLSGNIAGGGQAGRRAIGGRGW